MGAGRSGGWGAHLTGGQTILHYNGRWLGPIFFFFLGGGLYKTLHRCFVLPLGGNFGLFDQIYLLLVETRPEFMVWLGCRWVENLLATVPVYILLDGLGQVVVDNVLDVVYVQSASRYRRGHQYRLPLTFKILQRLLALPLVPARS